MSGLQIVTNSLVPHQGELNDLFLVSFSKTSSINYRRMVDMAKGAHYYAEAEDNGKPVHYAGFKLNREQLTNALRLVELLTGIKSMRIVIKGHASSHWMYVLDTLRCYLDSFKCDRKEAHCYSLIPHPFSDEPKNQGLYVMPCAIIKRWSAAGYNLYKSHPATPVEQIQAKAVKHGCDWCPNFNANAFQKM